MGLRGPLAKLRLSPAERLSSLDPPGWLDDEAAAFWRSHAQHLAADGLLNRHTVDAYSLCCDLWGRYRAETRPSFAVQLAKQVLNSCALFRLVPGTKEQLGQPEERHGSKIALEFD